jgi:hypothetical protein
MKKPLPTTDGFFTGVLEEYKFQITMTEVSGFSVQVSAFSFFSPTPETFTFGAWSLRFPRVQHSSIPQER